MAASSSLKNMALCLTGVCLVCSAILGGVYVLTQEPIARAEKANLQASLSQVIPDGYEISIEPVYREMDGARYECYNAAGAGENEVATAVKSTVNGFGGPLTVLVGVTSDGCVYAAKVLSHSETPGLGAKCSEAASHFVQQFSRFDPSQKSLKVKKDGGDIDAITASTITSRAYALAVENAVKLMKEDSYE
ncbi:MAG: RnfABCDGE type electron transport complex subunit G [Bacteroidales bacterium]|nr:RnfABCDGE type electron transport complex subunit G [Bacteroidales bacterium]